MSGKVSRNSAGSAPTAMVDIKSKFELELRRISLPRSEAERLSLESFYRLLTDAHCLPPSAQVQISYQNPRSLKLTAVESSADLATAIRGAAPLLRLFVSRLRGVVVEVSGGEDENEDDQWDGQRDRGEGKEKVRKGGTRNKGSENTANTNNLGDRENRGRQMEQVDYGRGDTTQLQTRNVADCIHPSMTAEEHDPLHTARHVERDCVNGLGTEERTCVSEGDREGDGLPEHPLVTLYKQQQQNGRYNAIVLGNEEALAGQIEKLSLSNYCNLGESSDDLQSTAKQSLANVIEIYNFSPSLDTRDLLQEFQDYSRAKLCIKWVDDTHALGVFASERQALVASRTAYRRVSVRMVSDGTHQSIQLAEKLGDELRPRGMRGGERPKTTAMVARRMVSNALGIRVKLSREQKQREMRELEKARSRATTGECVC